MGAKKLERSVAEVFLEQALREGRATEQELAIRCIKADPKLQSRVTTDPEHVHRLAGLMDMKIRLRPVVVFFDGKTYRLADGFHRLKALASRPGAKSISAYVVGGTERDAVLYSVSANLENSKPTSTEDRKKAVRMLLSDPEMFAWADSEIARRCGVVSRTVSRWRREWCVEVGVAVPRAVKFWDVRRDEPSYRKATRESVGRLDRSTVAPVQPESASRLSGALGRVAAKQSRQQYEDRALTRCGLLIDWLLENRVYAKSLGHDRALVGGVLLRGAYCVPMKESNRGAMLEAVARLVLIAKANEASYRLIVACKPRDFTTWAHTIAGICRSGPLPIEFMTPEELVAEFRPKGDESPEKQGSDVAPSDDKEYDDASPGRD